MHSHFTLTLASSCHSLITGLFLPASKLSCENHNRFDIRMKDFIPLSQEKGGGKEHFWLGAVIHVSRTANVTSHRKHNENCFSKQHAYSLKSH